MAGMPVLRLQVQAGMDEARLGVHEAILAESVKLIQLIKRASLPRHARLADAPS
jgi:hypothetical protein